MLVACVRIPRFAVKVERQRRENLTTRLILIGDATVYDCSLGAEASGVRRGMRMSEALALCHRADVLPPDPPYYQRRFDDVLDFLSGYSPEVEPGEMGNTFLALGGLSEHPGAYCEDLISALHRRLGFTASAGVARGKFTARVAASISRPGLAKVVLGEEVTFLAHLSIDHLPISDSARWRLRLLGVETIGEVPRMPLGAFQQQFGPEGKRCWELANGIDSEPLMSRVKEETVTRRLEMPAPAVTLEAILFGLERLVFAAYETPERNGRWVRKAVVRAKLDNDGSWEVPVPFREAQANPRDAWFAIRAAVERRPPDRPVEELEVELVGLNGESGKQAGMFEGKARLQRQVEEAIRQLNAQQQGRAPIGKVVEIEPWSRLPERRAALVEFDR